jgi:hypothetical protein
MSDILNVRDTEVIRKHIVEQELPTLPEHPSSPPVFIGVRVTRSLVLYVCFVDHCLSFCTFSFGHCVVCSSSIHGFWLPFWYLQTLLICNAVHILQEDVERYYKAYQNFAMAIIYSPDIVSINRNVLYICTMYIPLDHWVDTTAGWL